MRRRPLRKGQKSIKNIIWLKNEKVQKIMQEIVQIC